MVPSAFRVSHARPATSTPGAGDLGGASIVRPAATVADGEGVNWRMRDRKWCALLSGQTSSVLRGWSAWPWKAVDHTPFVSLSGTIFVAGGSR